MSVLFIPILIIVLVFYSTIKKNNTYTSFVNGSKLALDLVFSIMPYLVAIFILIEIYNASGLNYLVTNFFAPFMSFFGIPKELTELVILKNFTGSGSLAMLENIYSSFGTDSYIGNCASVIMACSEAVFYVTAVFFSKTKIKNYSYAIPLALILNFICAIIACFVCKFI